MVNPYTNKKNIYKFTKHEIKSMDKAWELINDFRQTEISRNKYRKMIIEKIKTKYQLDEFCILEIIIEKMYWNLHDTIKNNFDIDQHIYQKHLIDKYKLGRVKKNILIKNKKAKESNIRKSYIYDKNNNIVFYKYDYPDDLDLIISSIMINRSAYETIMGNKLSVNNLEIEPYNNNIEFDYPFPNLNTIEPFILSAQERLKNINNMYYIDNSEINWFL